MSKHYKHLLVEEELHKTIKAKAHEARVSMSKYLQGLLND